jgi:hypothetical protein
MGWLHRTHTMWVLRMHLHMGIILGAQEPIRQLQNFLIKFDASYKYPKTILKPHFDTSYKG